MPCTSPEFSQEAGLSDCQCAKDPSFETAYLAAIERQIELLEPIFQLTYCQLLWLHVDCRLWRTMTVEHLQNQADASGQEHQSQLSEVQAEPMFVKGAAVVLRATVQVVAYRQLSLSNKKQSTISEERASAPVGSHLVSLPIHSLCRPWRRPHRQVSRCQHVCIWCLVRMGGPTLLSLAADRALVRLASRMVPCCSGWHTSQA